MALSIERANLVIKCAKLRGFGGECGRVAIAINNVLFDGLGKYVIVTNEAYNRAVKDIFVGHVLVEFDNRLFDATGLVEDEEDLLTFGQFDDEAEWILRVMELGKDKDLLTEEERYASDLWYLDEIGDKAAQEEIIVEQTAGSCSIKSVEKALKLCLKKVT